MQRSAQSDLPPPAVLTFGAFLLSYVAKYWSMEFRIPQHTLWPVPKRLSSGRRQLKNMGGVLFEIYRRPKSRSQTGVISGQTQDQEISGPVQLQQSIRGQEIALRPCGRQAQPRLAYLQTQHEPVKRLKRC